MLFCNNSCTYIPPVCRLGSNKNSVQISDLDIPPKEMQSLLNFLLLNLFKLTLVISLLYYITLCYNFREQRVLFLSPVRCAFVI